MTTKILVVFVWPGICEWEWKN